MTKFLKNADVTGYISQTSVTSSLLKTDANGKLVAAVAGTDYQTPGSLANADKLVREVYNKTGATLTKGTVVYINDGQGNLPAVTKAIATGDSTSAQTFGVIQSDITNNNNGYVVIAGGLDNMNTNGLGVGTALYLSSTTAGEYTTTKQSAPNHLVYIGVVVRDHPTQGVIEVRIQNGYELEELHNVAISSLANNHTIVWESATSLWKNKTIAAALGYIPADDSAVVKLTGNQTVAGVKTFTSALLANNPSEGATGEGLIAGQSFKIDATGTGQRAIMYVVSKTLSDTYGSGLIAQYANFDGDKAFGFNLNTAGGFELYVKNTTFNKALAIANTMAATFGSSVTATSFIKSGGTSAQFLKADGSVDSSTYLTTGTASSTYLPLAGGTLTGAVIGTRLTLTQNSSDTALTVSNFGLGSALYVTGKSYFSSDISFGSFSNGLLKVNALGALALAVAGTDYLASYTESDTLATVTARGASTNTRTTFVELGVSKAGSDSVAAGPWFRWTNVAEDRQVLAQLNASNGLTYWTYNGSAWGAKMTLAQSGQLSLNNGVANGSGEALVVGGSGDVRLTDGGSIFWGAYDYDLSTYIRAYDNDNLMRFYLNGTNSVTFTSSGITSTGTVTAPTFSGALSGNATTASSTTYLSALGDYAFSASTNGRSFNRGIQTSFVRSEVDGYPSYGSVVRIRTYTGTEDGGTAELYFPYNSTYGGSSMRYRLGQYANAGWTGWKTVIDSDNIGSQSVSYASSAGAVAYANITASSVTGWMTSARNGTGAMFYLAHSGGYGMHINTYNQTGSIYALEVYNNVKDLLVVYNDGRVHVDGANQVLHAANYSSYAVPITGGTISGTLTVQGGGNNGSTYGIVSRDITAARTSTTGVIYLGSDGNRYVYYNGSDYVMPGANLVLNGGALINNTDGAALLESNGAENNNWIFRENSKAWGIFYFNRGTQSGQNIGGGYASVGAETIFAGSNVGVAMPSAWTGYNSSSKIAAYIDHNTGVMFSAGSMRSRIFYDSDNLSYYLDPDSNSRLYGAQYDYIGIGQSYNTSYRLITSGDIYLNANANGYAEGSWRQRRGGGTFYEVIDAGNYSGYNTYSNIYTSTLSVGGGYAEKIFDLGYFSHGVANIVAYIDFGNIQNSGYIEVEVNSTYSNQSSVGLLRKIIPFGTNLNASYWYSGDSKVQEANGSIPDNIFIGDLEWSGTNFRLPIYHVVSSGNAFTARVKYYTQAGNAAGILNAATVSTSTRSAPSNWSNNPTYNRAINTRNIQMFNNDIIGWRYSSGDSGMYNYIFNSYDNTTTGITYRSGSWTSSQNIVCHRFQTYSGNWTSWLTIYQDGGIVMPGRVDTGPIYAPTFYSSNDTSKYLDNNESSYGAWYVNGSQSGYSGFRFQGNMQLMMHTNGASGPCGLWLNNWSILTYVDSAQYLYHNGNEKFRTDSGGIYVTGTVYATGDVIAYYSDIRLKKDVEVIGGAISKIKQLRGVTYTWNDEAVNKVKERAGTRDIGLIAQEVEAVEPLLITEYQTQLNTPSNDPEEANNFVPEMSETYKTIKYEKLVALLIEGVKEQQEEISAQKSEISELKDLVKQLLAK